MARKPKDPTKTKSDGSANGTRLRGKVKAPKNRKVSLPMTHGMEIFCKRWMIRRNATRAYQDAFPEASYNTCANEGSTLLRDPRVRAVLDRWLADESARLNVEARKVSDHLAAIAFASLADFLDKDGNLIPLHELPRETTLALKRLKAGGEVELFDRVAALRLLGLQEGMFAEKVAVGADDALLVTLREARERALAMTEG